MPLAAYFSIKGGMALQGGRPKTDPRALRGSKKWIHLECQSLESSSIGGSVFWIFPGLWEQESAQEDYSHPGVDRV